MPEKLPCVQPSTRVPPLPNYINPVSLKIVPAIDWSLHNDNKLRILTCQSMLKFARRRAIKNVKIVLQIFNLLNRTLNTYNEQTVIKHMVLWQLIPFRKFYKHVLCNLYLSVNWTSLHIITVRRLVYFVCWYI